jgi:uncharacterized protein YbaR (Trm112 family)
MHANEYSKILVCPTTRQRLRFATEQELQALRLREGFEKIEDAWIRADRAVAYPVTQGIPRLTANNAISLRKTSVPKKSSNP